MNRFKLKISALLLSFLILITGCESTASLPSEIIASDDQSEQSAAFPFEVCGVTLDKAVEKAVSLSPAVTEIICELGFQSRLVGIGSYCDYPTSLSAPAVGSTENPDIDKIIGLKPDAVFTLVPLSEREIYTLGREGIAVITASVPSDVDGYAAMYSEIASAFWGKETAEDGARKYDKIGSDARAALENAASKANIGSFIYVTEKMTVAGGDTFESSVLGLAGENICSRSGYVTMQEYWEELTDLSPDHMIADSSLTEEQIRTSATLTKLLETGTKLKFVSSRCFERPTARTAEVFEQFKES